MIGGREWTKKSTILGKGQRQRPTYAIPFLRTEWFKVLVFENHEVGSELGNINEKSN